MLLLPLQQEEFYAEPEHFGDGSALHKRPPALQAPAVDKRTLNQLILDAKAGDQRASMIAAIGASYVALMDELDEEEFRELARFLRMVVDNDKNWPVTKMRAIRTALYPLNEAVKLVPRLIKLGDTQVLAHLERCIFAYLDELRDHLPAMIRSLKMIRKHARNLSKRVAAADLILKITMQATTTLAITHQQLSAQLRREAIGETSDTYDIDAEFKKIDRHLRIAQ